MSAKAEKVAKCSCKDLLCCNAIYKRLQEHGNEEVMGLFSIKSGSSNKIKVFRDNCRYWLGVPENLSDMRIRKSHFHVNVLRYLAERNKNVMSPISRAEVLKYGLLYYVKKLL